MVDISCRLETAVEDYASTLEQALLAESLGYSAVFVRDHLGLPDTDGRLESLECFTVLAGLARDTTRIGLGSLVACSPWRNPALVAKMAATIDAMSGGRLLLGLGAGNPRIDREFRRYGYDDTTSDGERARALGEALQVISLMWDKPEGASFSGEFYSIEDAPCAPRPTQRPRPPIFVGGNGERVTLPNIVAHADGWHSGLPPADYAKKVAVVDRLCAEQGRAPETVRRFVSQVVIVDEHANAKRRFDAMIEAKPNLPLLRTNTLYGPPELLVERIEEFASHGADEVIIYLWEPDLDRQADSIRAIGEAVIPKFSTGMRSAR